MARKSNAWGHKILPRSGPGDMCNAVSGPWKCRCGEVCEFWTVYSYVTGKAGRVTDRRTAVCRTCAQKFANRHGLYVVIDGAAVGSTTCSDS